MSRTYIRGVKLKSTSINITTSSTEYNIFVDIFWFADLAQVEAGADILQVFEAMGGFISEDHFYERAMPYLER